LDKTIVTALLIIAGVISAIFVFNAIFPAIAQGSDAMANMQRRIDDRMQTQIEIIHAAKADSLTVWIWVKNVGSLRIAPPEASDLFFGPQSDYARIPYNTGDPHWTYTLENDTEWRPGATLKISVSYTLPPPAGTYYIKVVLPNGISDETFVSW
jgi:archaellum component FlaF (FlaF/FlaG flagellin family)